MQWSYDITAELKLNEVLSIYTIIPGILHLQHQALGKKLNKLWPTFFIERF